MNRNKHTTGFTLVELMIVVAILALLIGMVMNFVWARQDSLKRRERLARTQAVENALTNSIPVYVNIPGLITTNGSNDLYDVRNLTMALSAVNEFRQRYPDKVAELVIGGATESTRDKYLIRYVPLVATNRLTAIEKP